VRHSETLRSHSIVPWLFDSPTVYRVMSIDAAIPAPFGIIQQQNARMTKNKVMQLLKGKQQEKISSPFWAIESLRAGLLCCRLNSESIIPLFLRDYELESLIFIVLLGQRMSGR